MSIHGRKNPNAGRKEIYIDVKKVEKLAAQGLNEEQIASVLGIHWTTLHARKRKYTEFSEALQAGKHKGIAAVTNAVFQAAITGNFPAMKFYLCNRDHENWKDKREFDSKSEDSVTVIHYECERDL